MRKDGSGGGSIETFLPDRFVGLPKLELPLLLAPLRSSLTIAFDPELARRRQGVLGHGWVLPIPHISRSKKNGIKYAGREFALFASPGAGDLVETTANRFKLAADDKLLTVESRGAYFILKDRDGATYLFGQSPNSRLHDASGQRVYAWFVDKVVDRHGNVAAFQYENINGVPYLKSIRYGSSNASRVPFELAFTYDQDSFSPTVFEFDFPTRNERLLRTIRVSVSGRTSRSYEFAYLGVPEAGIYLLESVVEKGTTDDNPRRYTLQYSPPSELALAPPWTGGPLPVVSVANKCATGDFNGDGKTDLACYAGNGGNWQMALSTGVGWSAQLWAGGPTQGEPVDGLCLTGDFNADGKTDLACYASRDGTWEMGLSTGNGWSSQLWTGGPSPGVPVGDKCLTGDFNGDGKTDLACYNDVGGYWQTVLSTGSGWNMTIRAGGPWPDAPVGDRCLTGDFNGDGKTDLACYTGSAGDWHMALATSGPWSTLLWKGGPAPGVQVANRCVTGDFNGDGKTDLACFAGNEGSWQMGLSTGSEWSAPAWTGGPSPGVPIGRQCLIGDFNGDGKTDLACYTGGGGHWKMALSTGSGWNSPLWTGAPAPRVPVGHQCVTGNFNEDGATDLACYTGSAGTWHMWLSRKSVPNALSKITMPTGISIDYEYGWSKNGTLRFLPSVLPVQEKPK